MHTDAAAGSNASRGGNDRAPQPRTATTPNRRAPNDRYQQIREIGETPNRRTPASNNRRSNSRNQQTGNEAMSPVARLISRGLDIATDLTASAANLFGQSPRNTRGRQPPRSRGNTEPQNRVRNTGTSHRDGQQNVQSGNGEAGVQVEID